VTSPGSARSSSHGLAPDAYSDLLARVGEETAARIRRDEPLAPFTSFRIGGPADLLFEPADADMLAQLLAVAHELGISITRLGGGTNVLVSDRGVRGLVIRLGRDFDYRRWGEEIEGSVLVEVGAATRLGRLVKESVERGLEGLEFAAVRSARRSSTSKAFHSTGRSSFSIVQGSNFPIADWRCALTS
jgi:FAD/FMN-containing dehydrogenase